MGQGREVPERRQLVGIAPAVARLVAPVTISRISYRLLAAFVLIGGILASGPLPCEALAQFELSEAVHLDEADSATRAHLERVRAYVDDGQWDEAVETLRKLMELHGSKVVAVAPGRYVSLADYCHLLISALPEEAIELYRGRVDPLAEKWYTDAVAARDADRLRQIVDQMYCSTWGDDALWTLGEIALERGEYAAARILGIAHSATSRGR